MIVLSYVLANVRGEVTALGMGSPLATDIHVLKRWEMSTLHEVKKT